MYIHFLNLTIIEIQGKCKKMYNTVTLLEMLIIGLKYLEQANFHFIREALVFFSHCRRTM